jgi:hypothetical protein
MAKHSMKSMLVHLELEEVLFPVDGRSRLKALDEYNFVTYALPALNMA